MSSAPPSFLKRCLQFLKAPFRHGNKSIDTTDENYERSGLADLRRLRNSIINVLLSQSKRVPDDLHLCLQLIDAKLAGGYEDDSKYLVCPYLKSAYLA